MGRCVGGCNLQFSSSLLNCAVRAGLCACVSQERFECGDLRSGDIESRLSSSSWRDCGACNKVHM